MSPGDDEPKHIAQYFIREFAGYAASRGHRVLFMQYPLLPNFTKAVVQYDPDFVLINGHGGSKGVTGLDLHVILGVSSFDPELGLKIEGENPSLMAGRVVYLLSCYNGRELAGRLVQNGAVAVAAYKDAFIFLSDYGMIPLSRDEKGKRFMSAALEVARILVDSGSFGEACKATMQAYRDNRDLADLEGDVEAAKYFHFDLVNFVYLGSMTATLM